MLQFHPITDVLHVTNRRETSRIAPQTSISMALTGEKIHAINVSESGARLVLRGDKSALYSSLSLQIGGLDIEGRVVWEQAMPGGGCRVAGVRFERLSQTQQAALREFA